jgi:hypothetical protein
VLLVAFACIAHHIGTMAQTRTKGSDRATSRRGSGRPSKPATKVAITLRLDAARVRQLQAVAEAENRSITNYVETALIHHLSLRDEAARVITVHAAPGTSERIAPEDIVRGEGESGAAFARRQELLVALWSIPDSD